jgi:hypothetical protein
MPPSSVMSDNPIKYLRWKFNLLYPAVALAIVAEASRERP